MPRVLIDVNEAWIERLQQVIPAAIDSLAGWELQIEQTKHAGTVKKRRLLTELQNQIVDLRRSIESVRIIF